MDFAGSGDGGPGQSLSTRREAGVGGAARPPEHQMGVPGPQERARALWVRSRAGVTAEGHSRWALPDGRTDAVLGGKDACGQGADHTGQGWGQARPLSSGRRGCSGAVQPAHDARGVCAEGRGPQPHWGAGREPGRGREGLSVGSGLPFSWTRGRSLGCKGGEEGLSHRAESLGRGRTGWRRPAGRARRVLGSGWTWPRAQRWSVQPGLLPKPKPRARLGAPHKGLTLPHWKGQQTHTLTHHQARPEPPPPNLGPPVPAAPSRPALGTQLSAPFSVPEWEEGAA